jgi:hypothetical protein
MTGKVWTSQEEAELKTLVEVNSSAFNKPFNETTKNCLAQLIVD